MSRCVLLLFLALGACTAAVPASQPGAGRLTAAEAVVSFFVRACVPTDRDTAVAEARRLGMVEVPLSVLPPGVDRENLRVTNARQFAMKYADGVGLVLTWQDPMDCEVRAQGVDRDEVGRVLETFLDGVKRDRRYVVVEFPPAQLASLQAGDAPNFQRDYRLRRAIGYVPLLFPKDVKAITFYDGVAPGETPDLSLIAKRAPMDPRVRIP